MQVRLGDISAGWTYANDDRRAVLAGYAARQGGGAAFWTWAGTCPTAGAAGQGLPRAAAAGRDEFQQPSAPAAGHGAEPQTAPTGATARQVPGLPEQRRAGSRRSRRMRRGRNSAAHQPSLQFIVADAHSTTNPRHRRTSAGPNSVIELTPRDTRALCSFSLCQNLKQHGAPTLS